jgi:hypothetical protein
MRIRRYSQSHLAVELTIAGRGLYFSRTPDGTWWRLRLRRRSCSPTSFWAPPEPPPQVGVREPRRPFGPGPLGAASELDLP